MKTSREVVTVEYDILSGRTPNEIISKVNFKLGDGWELFGSLVVDNGGFFQTMVKR